MQMTKYGLAILLLALCLGSCSVEGARRLRKKPKVYNALITTDDNLTSSRAYPVIQPTIHEPGYAPFGPYNPFGFYSPPLVRFTQPLVPGLPPNERLPYPLPTTQFPPIYSSYDPSQPHIVSAERQPPPQPELSPQTPAAAAGEPQEPKQIVSKDQLPLPLNEQGLPPVLIPLNSQFGGQPTHPLPPYGYNQYPLIYDQAGFVRPRENYLPPYDYYPSQGYPLRSPAPQAPAMQPPQPPQPPQQQQQQQEEEEQVQPLALDSLDSTPSFDDIKNGSQNKHSDVPDVPPPPIPSGPKRS